MSATPPPLWLVILLSLGTGSAGAGVGSILNTDGAGLEVMRRDIADNAKEIEGVDEAQGAITESVLRDRAAQSAWMLDHLIDMHTSLNAINRKLGLDEMATIRPLGHGTSP